MTHFSGLSLKTRIAALDGFAGATDCNDLTTPAFITRWQREAVNAMTPDRIVRQPFDASGTARKTPRVHSPIRSPPAPGAWPEVNVRRSTCQSASRAAEYEG